jgi:hypothetical protein
MIGRCWLQWRPLFSSNVRGGETVFIWIGSRHPQGALAIAVDLLNSLRS